MSETKPGIKAQMLSDRQVDKIDGYQNKIRALRDNYASFEVALAEAQRQLKTTNEQIVKSQKNIVETEEVATRHLEDRKSVLQDEITLLQNDRKNLSDMVTKMHTELHDGMQKLKDEQKKVADLDRDLRCGLADLEKAKGNLTRRIDEATMRESELDRIEDANNEILAHTKAVESRVEQKQAQLDSTLDSIKNNRLAELEAKKDAETAQQEAEKAKKELIVAQQERNELRQKQKSVDEKYDHAVELFDGAKDLQQKNSIKEVALRSVQEKLNREKGQLHQAQIQLSKEIETFRREKENGGKDNG